MAIEDDVKKRLSDEAERIEEDAEHSSKGHYNAAGPWQAAHLLLGVLSAILSAVAAGVAAQKGADLTTVVVGVSLAAGALTATVTFLKPNEQSDRHRRAGDRYLDVKNRARFCRTVEMEATSATEPKLIESLRAIQVDLASARTAAPLIPEWAYRKARKGIAEGQAKHRVDTKPQ